MNWLCCTIVESSAVKRPALINLEQVEVIIPPSEGQLTQIYIKGEYINIEEEINYLPGFGQIVNMPNFLYRQPTVEEPK